MSDNPLETSPEREAQITQRMRELHEAGGGALEEYREKADELVRMEMAGSTGQLPIETRDRVDEAKLEENLGEFPGGSSVADQGDWRETPMTREELKHPEERQPGHGDAP